MICEFSTECSGCSNWGQPFSEQESRKEAAVLSLLKQAGLGSPAQVQRAALPEYGLRDRLDFQIRDGAIGLWDHDRKVIVDLPVCLQLTPELQAWLTEFRSLKIPLRRGSFRLRVNPQGDRGVWLDLANEDVRDLFAEKSFLRKLTEKAFVEIGQRRKALVFEGDTPKLLKDPRLHPWTRTWLGNQSFDLWSRIADFSQVGDLTNQALIKALQSLLPDQGQKAVEFGSGNGNLSFPIFEQFQSLICYESDASANLSLRKSLDLFEEKYPLKKDQMILNLGDFQKNPADLKDVDTLILNPPRSGVGNFLADLPAGLSDVKHLIYMSCYPESMVKDLSPLQKSWTCEKLIFVDQFPQTNHLEVLSCWRRLD